MQNLENKKRMETWKVQSSDEKGFHKVITPDTCECQEAQMFRLNLPAGESYTLESKELELHPVLLAGKAKLSGHESLDQDMEKFDSCYIPGNDKLTILQKRTVSSILQEQNTKESENHILENLISHFLLEMCIRSMVKE